MAESFSKNDGLSNEAIEEKAKRLLEDVILIHKYKETNKFYTNYTDLYPQPFYDKYTVQDFICSPHILKLEGVDRDVINAIQKILEKSTETTITSKEVIEDLFNWNDDENCHGIMAFHEIEQLDNSLQIIYGMDGWYKFRRHFLSIYPKTSIFFIDECAKYFPNLFFHERNKTTIGTILHNCPKKIVYHLTALNDKFRESQGEGRNRTQVLEHFSVNHNLDETASLQGDASKKSDLTFKFVNSDNVQEDVCCEPHLKLCYNDYYPGDNSYSTDRRIYFHEGKDHIHSGNILVGHIGDHL